ncbi:MAG: DUF4127 family protein, partial [Armatimonadetes bacterium]|nr:DUF4127 family protein [Armatimonadota bacterium]
MKIAYLPLDDRPCTSRFPRRLGAIAGVAVESPAVDPYNPDSEGVRLWLLGEGEHAKVISVDMLAYGGLVPSREILTPFEECADTISFLPEITETSSVYLFHSIMRLSPTIRSPGDGELAESLRRHWQGEKVELPPGCLERYLAIRKRNFALNCEILRQHRRKPYSYLIFCSDDTAPYGPAAAERKELEKSFEGPGMILPGADETGMLLLTRAILDERACRFKVCPLFFPDDSRRVITKYEDRTLEDLVGRQIEASGAVAGKDGDLYLLVSGPLGSQKEALFQERGPETQALCASLAEKARTLLGAGKLAAIADVRYANGADKELVSRLREEVPLHTLASYAAWNTTGNSTGTALAHGLCRRLGLSLPPGPLRTRAERSHREFLMERFMDDWAYQSIVRPEINDLLQK